MLRSLSVRSPLFLRVFLTGMSALAAVCFASAFSFAPATLAAVTSYPARTAASTPLRESPRAAVAGNQVTVLAGETLSGIAGGMCGTAADWSGFFAANRSVLSDPDLIEPGQLLTVNCADPGYTPPAPPPVPVQQVGYVQPAKSSYSGSKGSYSGTGSFQSCVISRESGGNPSAVNPASGAGGLYGFLPSTWQSLGFSGLPENASVTTQNQAFAEEYAQAGTSPWTPSDGC
jgi:hypothetical protein